MSRKIVGLTLLGALGGVLIYPGIPVGVRMDTVTSPAGGYTKMDCYKLFITGVRRKHIEIRHEPGAAVDVNNKACLLPG